MISTQPFSSHTTEKLSSVSKLMELWPTKIPLFIFAAMSEGNLPNKYMKAALFLLIAFTKFYINFDV